MLDGVFVAPEAKAVVFSQWTRTHDIVIRRLEDRGIGYVSFHGGVPSEKRPALVERFCTDPHCRVFLSTDAGAAGLNLQHASTLVNMDLPWNPALLEQRIGRIHRTGQKRPVQVVNFVAKGTIEEGMLSVLAFKRSLSAGILDGGQSEISLGGSRLARFMKEVENVTGRMGEGDAVTPTEEMGSVASAVVDSTVDAGDADVVAAAGSLASAAAASPRKADAPARQQAVADPWGVLVQAGTQLISALRIAGDSQAPSHPWLERDPATGACSLRLPLPAPAQARQLADAVSAIADSLRGARASERLPIVVARRWAGGLARDHGELDALPRSVRVCLAGTESQRHGE